MDDLKAIYKQTTTVKEIGNNKINVQQIEMKSTCRKKFYFFSPSFEFFFPKNDIYFFRI